MTTYIILGEHGDVYKTSSDERAKTLTEIGYLVINVTDMKVMLLDEEIRDGISPDIHEVPDSENI